MDFGFGLLFWFCLTLSIFGLSIFFIGLTLQLMYLNGGGLIDINFLSAPSLLIFCGIFIFVVALLGCYGATKGNYCMLMSFSLLMLFLFTIGVAGAIACYVNRGQLENIVEDQLNGTMHEYYTNLGYQKSWDFMQTELKCCGIKGPMDWESFGNKTVPNSCCKEMPFDEKNKQFTCTEANIYNVGCFPSLLEVLKRQAVILGTSAAIVSGLQILVIAFTCYLAGSVRRDYQTV